MVRRVSTHLMFQHGDAGDALQLYADCFDDFEVVELERYGSGEPGPEGTVKYARFTLAGREFSCADSPVTHGFGFTPSVSIFLDCDGESELERLTARLADGGEFLMPLGDYGFSTRFGWVNDRHGVSWQLNLP